MGKAWPFVDTDKLSANLSSPPHHLSSDFAALTMETSPLPQESCVTERAPSIVGNPESPAASPSPCPYPVQQVVWVPMIVNWPCADFAVSAPYAGVPLAMTDTAIL